MRSTTAVIMGLLTYEPPVIDQTTQDEIMPAKHVINLEDISLVSTNRNNGNNHQSLNVPWLNVQSNGGTRSRVARGASPRTSRRGQNTLAQMALPRNQSLSSALEANPVPNMDGPADPNDNLLPTLPTQDRDEDQERNES